MARDSERRLVERRGGSNHSSPRVGDSRNGIGGGGGAHDKGRAPRRCTAGSCSAGLIFVGGLVAILLSEWLRLSENNGLTGLLLFQSSMGMDGGETASPAGAGAGRGLLGGREAGGRRGSCGMPPEFAPSEEEVFDVLKRYPRFDLQVPMVRKYARLIHGYLEPWYPIKGASKGLGSRGLISPEALQALATQPAVMSCNGHIKVSQGKVYFRYGGFWHVYYRLHRFLQTVKMVQDAVTDYGLTDLQLEMFINTCDHPQSFYSGHWPDRSGYPIMSTGFTVDTKDIPIPDPLDLTPDYTPDLSLQIPWSNKFTRLVFRGKTTNFDMLDGNWGANPRIRLHRMSDVPENEPLMDAHINSWSHATDAVQKQMEEDGLILAKRMNFTQFNAFKYQVIVDGGGGSCRTCGVLRSNQMSFRQRTPLLQFHEPLVEDNVHWLVVKRTFDDLPDKIRWLREHDDTARQLVEAANEFATYGCTLRGRTLYWALMLVKYQEAIMDRDKIQVPTTLCKDKATLQTPPGAKNPALVKCNDPDADKKQTGTCTWFCAGGQILESRHVWLSAETHLKGFEGVGPP